MQHEDILKLEANELTNALKVNSVFTATIGLVWDAWTTAKMFDLWWAPEGYKSTTKSMIFEEGGSRYYPMPGPHSFKIGGLINSCHNKEGVTVRINQTGRNGLKMIG